MDFDLTPEQQDLRSTIRRFLSAEVEPRINDHEASGTFPFELLPQLADLGFMGGYLPVDVGGHGISRVTWAMMFEELGYCWGSLRTVVNIANGVAHRIAMHGTAEQREHYLLPILRGEGRVFQGITEPDAGSNVREVRTRATLDGDSWVIDGQKLWITGGASGTYGTIIARTYSPTCDGDLSLFIVDREQSSWEAAPVSTMVLRCSGTGELTFRGTRVPRDNLLGEEGQALKMTLTGLAAARVNVAAGAVGGAQRAFDLSVAHVQDRHQFGRPIGSFQLVQKHVVDMRLRIDAARALMYRAAAAIDKGLPARTEGSLAKLYATESAHEVANRALQVHGAMGYAAEYPIERIFRDTRGGSIPEGTTEIQSLIIGRELLGISAIC